MATYQIINLQTGEFQTLSLDEAAAIAQLDPHEIELAVEEHGVCETDAFQITKLPEPPEGNGVSARDQLEGDAGDGGDGGDGDSILPLPVLVYISQEEFEAHLAQFPAAVIRLKWHEPIVHEAVEARRDDLAKQLSPDASADKLSEPSAVYHLTRVAIALIR
jgi:hypothetical protein